MDVARADSVDAELDRLISKRALQDRRPDRDELEPYYMESVRRYNARRHEEMRAAWCEHHQGQAVRLRAVVDGRSTERSSVVARERYGNGYLGRGGTRRRMRSRARGYVGSEKVLNGPAKRCAAPSWARTAQPWGYGKAWR